MSFWERVSNLNRRYIYILVALGVIIPLVVKMNLPIYVTSPTKKVYELVDAIPPEDSLNVLFISFDFGPNVKSELLPMGVALLKHCFAKKIRVACMALSIQGIGLAEMAVKEAKEEFPEVKYGEDYIILAWVPTLYSSVTILRMGENLKETFKTDYTGKSVDDFPIMKGLKNYNQIPVLVTLTASGLYMTWATYANVTYNQTICAGITGVIAPEVYPWLQSQQIKGLLGGIKGAAEYETLLMRNGLVKKRGKATIAMNPQSIVHILIMCFIIVANISYFMVRRRKR